MRINPKYKEGQLVLLIHEEDPSQWMVTAYIIEGGALLYRLTRGQEVTIAKDYEIKETLNFN